MRMVSIIGVGLVLLIAAAFAWSQWNYPTYTYRYRITLSVSEGGALKSGASVVEITRRWDPVPGRPIEHYTSTAIGDAPFVELNDDRRVFLTFANDGVLDPERLAAKRFGFDPADVSEAAEQSRRANEATNTRASAELPSDRIPLLVVLTGQDASSARAIPPMQLGTTLGENVSFKSATVEMTSDAVTSFLQSRFPILLDRLKQDATVLHVERMGEPFRLRLGHVKRGK
jgi:hypothetical protein